MGDWEREVVPLRQTRQVEAPVEEKVPGEQAVQPLTEEKREKVPGEQRTHVSVALS